MCGIAGYISTSANGKLETMNQKMIHRGPDDEGYYSKDIFHLCMRRLSILDIERGKQPIFNQDKSAVVMFNGEIYNYIELQNSLKLKGHKFQTNSDTEVIAHLYDEYGINFIRQLNGMFAIALLDTKTNELYLIRDRIGEKPIYYFYDAEKKELEFASEFNVINNGNLKEEINFNALIYYFSQKALPTSDSINKKIKKLPPGSYLHLKKNHNPEIVKYYSFNRTKGENKKSENEIINELTELIVDSIKLRIRADVEVGAFLSGGLDSSLIVSIASDMSKKPLKTYALIYNEKIYKKEDDKKYANQVSKLFSTIHKEVLLTPELLIEELPKIVKHYGQPNSAVISNWFISKEMSKELKVALSGDGADELFGSYFLHRVCSAIHNSKKDITYIEKYFKAEKDFIVKNLDNTLTKIIDNFSIFNNDELQLLLNNKYFKQIPILKIIEKKVSQVNPGDLLDMILEYDINNLLVEQILNYTDTLGMAHSLEIRVPYLDHRIVEYALSLEPEYKIRSKETKYILKKVAEKYLPKEIIYREKEGFVEPGVYWLQKELKDFCLSNLKSKEFNKLGFLNNVYVNKLIDSFYNSHDFFVGKKIWNLLMFALWEKYCAA